MLEQKGSVRGKEFQRECCELMAVLIPHCLTLLGWENVESEMKD